tara:strand:- start:553 stop:1341 length:789 start_codon:yes stop_codon:yes gene_type:complete
MAKGKQKQKELYFFYSNGCVFCSKMEPHVDEFIKDGHNILKLNISDKDNLGLKKEIEEKYNKQCGTPWLIDPETGNQICGFNKKDIIQKWLDGEDIPTPPTPKGQMPRPPFNNASEEEVESWKKQYNTWLEENSHLPDVKTAEEILEFPRPNSMPPNPPSATAPKEEIEKWTESYDKWYNDNTHLPNIKTSAEVLKIFNDRKKQVQGQTKMNDVDVKIEVTQLRVEVNELKSQLDSIIKHLGVPHKPLWQRRQEQQNKLKEK